MDFIDNCRGGYFNDVQISNHFTRGTYRIIFCFLGYYATVAVNDECERHDPGGLVGGH